MNTTNNSSHNEAKLDGGGTTQSISSVFIRESRTCRVCRSTTTQDCSGKILRNGRKLEQSCTTRTVESEGEKCDNIEM